MSPGYIVYEDARTIAFLDIHPASDGHTMVLPKVHGDTIFDIERDDMASVFETVKRVARIIEEVFQASVITIGINHGEPSRVQHLHVHLIPRIADDGEKVIQSLPRSSRTRPLHEIYELLQSRFP